RHAEREPRRLSMRSSPWNQARIAHGGRLRDGIGGVDPNHAGGTMRPDGFGMDASRRARREYELAADVLALVIRGGDTLADVDEIRRDVRARAEPAKDDTLDG